MKTLILLLMTVSAAAAAEPSLAGLWAARRNAGTDVRGTLTIADGRAMLAGRSAPVTIQKDQVSFALAAGEGSFRGVTRGDRMAGHWIQQGGVLTPVTLTRNARGQWRGTVTPIEDHMVVFLPVTKNEDGTLATFVRNPERNFGVFAAVERIVADGAHVKLLGKEGDVRAEGTYDAESDVMSIPLRGGTYDFHRATAADEAAFYPRGKNPEPYVYRKPMAEDDGWPVASVEDVGISREAITRFIDLIDTTPIDSLHASDVHAVLIARHGKLVVEEYFHNADPDEPHDTRSAAKSLLSMLVGAAMLKGEPVSTSTRVYDAMGRGRDDADPNKRAITLEHLLTMSAGLDCDDADGNSPGAEDTMQQQTAQPDWYAFTLDLKSIRKPGEKAVYCSCQPNLAGGVLARTTHKRLEDLIHDLLATPLQMGNYGLWFSPTHDVYMGGGLRFRARDFMKLGQVMLDGGRWNGRQIVSAEWAKRSISPLVNIGERPYGYLWWLSDYPYKDRQVRAFYAAGNGGQIVMGVPELDLLIAFFGGNYNDRALFIPQRVYVPEQILPAVNDEVPAARGTKGR
jgi:CubicO group peptidase (beta-lactamase class C family)